MHPSIPELDQVRRSRFRLVSDFWYGQFRSRFSGAAFVRAPHFRGTPPMTAMTAMLYFGLPLFGVGLGYAAMVMNRRSVRRSLGERRRAVPESRAGSATAG